MLASENQPGMTPLVPVVNLKELLSDVEGLRRPSAREVMDAVVSGSLNFNETNEGIADGDRIIWTSF